MRQQEIFISPFFIALLFFSYNIAYSQGCSDAGFCTAGTLKGNGTVHEDKDNQFNAFSLTFGVGNGERKTTVLSPQIEYMRSLNNHSFFELKLPYYIASGDAGDNSGIGDPIVTYVNNFTEKNNFRLSFSAGARIGIAKTNATNKQHHSMPMVYQPGLGTTDIILGLSVAYKQFLSFAMGYQQPLFQYNNNGYLRNQYPTETEAYKSYADSRMLQRKGDVLLRASAYYNVKKFRLSAGPLLIYHLGEDKATDINNQTFSIKGSSGVTLNVTAGLQYVMKDIILDCGLGAPLITRDVRPDGLTRSWVVMPKISYRF